MEVTTLNAEDRKALGTKQVARLREAGRVPCVLYGDGGETVSLSLSETDVERELRKHHRVFRLVKGGKTQGVLIQDVQFDVITDRPLHIDFLRIDLDKPVQVEVEIVFVGHPVGLSKGGSLVRDRATILVESLPAAVPEDIKVGVKHMDIGDRILASEMQLPEGVTLGEGLGDEQICHLPMAETEAAPAAEEGEEGGEAPAEGEEPKPEGDS